MSRFTKIETERMATLTKLAEECKTLVYNQFFATDFWDGINNVLTILNSANKLTDAEYIRMICSVLDSGVHTHGLWQEPKTREVVDRFLSDKTEFEIFVIWEDDEEETFVIYDDEEEEE